MEGTDHQSVVQLIRQSGDSVTLKVVSVSEDEARRLEPDTSMSPMDYYERRSVPISVPEFQKVKDEAGREYVTFHIHLSSKLIISRRYREFDALNGNVSTSVVLLLL